MYLKYFIIIVLKYFSVLKYFDENNIKVNEIDNY